MSVRLIVAVGAVAVMVAACGMFGGTKSERAAETPTPQAKPAPSKEPTPAAPEERARAHTELGAGYLQLGNLAVAMQEFQEAIKIEPRYVPAHTLLGLVQMELKEDSKAQASFQRALKIDPNDSDANNAYGNFLCARKREKEAIKYYLTALKNPLYQTAADSNINAGICARRAGEDGAAEQFFQRALSLQPNEPRALINLGKLRFTRGDLTGARDYVTRYMQRVQTPDADSLWLGARIEQRVGDRNALLSYGTQLRNRFPDAPETKAYNEGRFE